MILNRTEVDRKFIVLHPQRAQTEVGSKSFLLYRLSIKTSFLLFFKSLLNKNMTFFTICVSCLTDRRFDSRTLWLSLCVWSLQVLSA